jgi:hypothetical protein
MLILTYILSLITYSKYFFIGFKKWFLVEKTLYKHVNILLSLAINGIADDAVRKWKKYKKLLKYLILIKSIFHPKVNSFNMSGKALNIYLRILNTSVFRHLIYDKLTKILSTYGEPLFVISF